MELPQELIAKIDEIITHYPASRRSAVLSVLHVLQKHDGYISDDSVTWTAEKLGLQPVQVMEVVTFYPGFRRSAPGKYHIRVCRTLSCAMAGSYELMETLSKATGIDRSHVDHHHPIAKSADGAFSIEFAECLASCGSGPVCMFNDDFYERVSAEEAQRLVAEYRRK